MLAGSLERLLTDFMKFCGEVALGPRNNGLDFGVDADPDRGFFSSTFVIFARYVPCGLDQDNNLELVVRNVFSNRRIYLSRQF